MHFPERERQEQHHDAQRSYLEELGLYLERQAHHFLPTNLWSQSVNFVTENSPSIHLLSLFVVFLIVQTAHVHNVNKLKADLATFLVENEVITSIDQDVALSAFMEQYGKKLKSTSKGPLECGNTQAHNLLMTAQTRNWEWRKVSSPLSPLWRDWDTLLRHSLLMDNHQRQRQPSRLCF